MPKSRLKKGQIPRFRKGQLVRAIEPERQNHGRWVSTWDQPPRYDATLKNVLWMGLDDGPNVISRVHPEQILVIVEVHNFPYPSKEQYCLVFHDDAIVGWVNSYFLQKIL